MSICCRRIGTTRWNGEVGLISIGEIEQTETGCVIDTVIQCKLCRGELVDPIRLVAITEHTEVSRNFAVHRLCLPVCLWMIGRRDFRFHSQSLQQRAHYVRRKLRSPVQDQLPGYAVELEDVATVYFCYTIRVNLVRCWHHVNLLPVIVHGHCNCVEAFDVGQSRDEVLADYLPQAFWYIIGC
jgi:hypothetical protein